MKDLLIARLLCPLLGLLAACQGDLGSATMWGPDAGFDGGSPIARDSAMPPSPPLDASITPSDPRDAYARCSDDDICVALPYPVGDDLRAATMLDGTLLLVGDNGTLLRYADARFKALDSGVVTDLQDIQAGPSGHAYVVGSEGTLLDVTASAVTPISLNAALGDSAALTDLTAVAPLSDGLLVAGHSSAGPVLLRRTGQAFVSLNLSEIGQGTVRAMAALADDDVWLVGDAGLVLHYDGSTLSKKDCPTAQTLLAVAVRADGELWIGGEAGTLLRRVDEAFESITAASSSAVRAIVLDDEDTLPELDDDAGMPAMDAGLAAFPKLHALHEDGTIARFDGHQMVQDLATRPRALYGAARQAEGDYFAVGAACLVERFSGGATATLSAGGTNNYLTANSTPDGTLLLLGDGALSRLSEALLRPLSLASKRALFGAALDGDTLWAVGTAGTLVSLTGDDSQAFYPRPLLGRWLRAVSAVDGVLHVVGNEGFWATRDADGTWTVLDSGVSTSLHAVWAGPDGEVWVAGDEGTVLHLQGGVVERIPAGPEGEESTESLRSIDGRNGALWIVGQHGTILHWDGERVEVEQSGEGYTLNAILVSASDDIDAVGTGGHWLHFDGQAWTPLLSPTSASLQALSRTPEGTFAAGLAGTLLHRLPPRAP